MDHMQAARYFEASVHFQNCLGALEKKASELTEKEKESLAWTGTILERIDWDCENHQSSGLDSYGIATHLRPLFYETLANLAQQGFFPEQLSRQSRAKLEAIYCGLKTAAPEAFGSTEIAVTRTILERFKWDTLYKFHPPGNI